VGATPKHEATLEVAFLFARPLFEVAMTETTHSPHCLVCEYLERRTHSVEPPATPDEIRRELGWALIAAERQAQAECDERD